MAGTGKALCSSAGAVLCSAAGAVLYDGVAVSRVCALSFVSGSGGHTYYYPTYDYAWRPGETGTAVFRISNTGNTALSVTAISPASGFSVNWSSGTIAAGGHQDVTVSFTIGTYPPDVNLYWSVAVTSNATSNSGSVKLAAWNYEAGCD